MENSSSSSPNPYSFRPFQITEEQLHAFHLTDRKLYKILIHDLERGPFESMHIMAFWMWLEKQVCIKVNLIHTLVEFPYNLINEVADETLICLLTCQNDQFLIPNILNPSSSSPSSSSSLDKHGKYITSTTNYELAVLPNLAYPNHSTKKLSLQDFHQNRALVILNVNKLVKDVCIRGFKDLIFPVIKNPDGKGELQQVIHHDDDDEETSDHNSMKKIKGFYDNKKMFCKVTTPPTLIVPPPPPPPLPFVVNILDPLHAHFLNHHLLLHHHHHPSNPSSSNNYMYKEGGDDDSSSHFLPVDRTVFITFSKGYPVSELEVKDFFTRRFGDCIEAVYMQIVRTGQQPLYARVVVSSASMVDLMVGGGRAKYNIYGKHVWARKYVKQLPGKFN